MVLERIVKSLTQTLMLVWIRFIKLLKKNKQKNYKTQKQQKTNHMDVNGLHKINYKQITTQKMSKYAVELVAIFQQPATKASWSSNFYIYYRQLRKKVLRVLIY